MGKLTAPTNEFVGFYSIAPSGVILMHNHPSNNVNPSTADVKMTESLKKALGFFDISLMDHIIIGEDRYYSFSNGSETKD